MTAAKWTMIIIRRMMDLAKCGGIVIITVTPGPRRHRFAFVWNQEDCTDSGYYSLAKKDKPIFMKQLNKIWDGIDLPWPKGTYSSTNTLLIETEPCKALLNPVQKGSLEFFLKAADDVPCYVKQHPFGQPAITPSHPDWNYYKYIIRHLGKTTE
ncbi:hypothetical protein M9H77_00453 [Catharanthus roseus]|nr:hypothetical protein M9H77_00453 [Catharanthus roseus]